MLRIKDTPAMIRDKLRNSRLLRTVQTAQPPLQGNDPSVLLPPRREKLKRYLPFNKRKRRNKERLWMALYQYTGPGAKGGDDARWQKMADPDKIEPVVDPDEKKYVSSQTTYLPTLEQQPNCSRNCSHCPRYHWAFLLGPKHEDPFSAVPGMRYEVTQDPWTGRWQFHRHFEVDIRNTGPTMLVRMKIGKVVDKERFQHVLYATPVDGDGGGGGSSDGGDGGNREKKPTPTKEKTEPAKTKTTAISTSSYRNKEWVAEAMAALAGSVRQGIMAESSRLDWGEVGTLIDDMCRKRAAAGVFDGKQFDHNIPRPAFDLMEGRWVFEG
jgi:hypothetical protein